jgi:hypothetical protein
MAHIVLPNIPMRPVQAQCRATILIYLDGFGAFETGSLQTKGLAATAGAKFYGS